MLGRFADVARHGRRVPGHQHARGGQGPGAPGRRQQEAGAGEVADAAVVAAGIEIAGRARIGNRGGGLRQVMAMRRPGRGCRRLPAAVHGERHRPGRGRLQRHPEDDENQQKALPPVHGQLILDSDRLLIKSSTPADKQLGLK